MAKDTDKVTLGNGDLYLNAIDVGHLKGTVEFIYELEKVEFKPANMLGAVKQFIVRENATLRASLAELKAANVRLAMGVSTAVDGSTSFPAFNPGSYSAPSGGSFDVLTFGGEKTVNEVPLTFVHTRPDGQVVVVILYKAVTEGGLNLPFNEEEVTLHDVTFKGLADADRSEGDQVGFFAEQVQ
jgi:hypothetical protein